MRPGTLPGPWPRDGPDSARFRNVGERPGCWAGYRLMVFIVKRELTRWMPGIESTCSVRKAS